MSPIVLASQSPRRKQLLQWAEVDFEVMVADTDESYPAHLSPSEVAIYIAKQKGEKIREKIKDRIIIAADTIVVHNGYIIGKPKDRDDALSILGRLNGSLHQVVTGVVISNAEKEKAFSDTTEVLFHQLTDKELEFYVDKYQPYDKAGAYAIQEWIGVVGIKSIKGDFYNVMGLPVSRVVQSLREFSPDK